MHPNFGIEMVLFQNFYLPAHRVATVYSEIYTQLLISWSEFDIIPQQYHFQLIQPIRFLLLSRASLNNQSHYR